MNVEEFMKHANFTVNGPAYYGAPMPDADPNQVNECTFSHKLRFKDVNIEVNNNTITIKWISQEWDDNTDPLVKEIMRYYLYVADKVELDKDINLIITIEDRDHTGSKVYEKVIEKCLF